MAGLRRHGSVVIMSRSTVGIVFEAVKHQICLCDCLLLVEFKRVYREEVCILGYSRIKLRRQAGQGM